MSVQLHEVTACDYYLENRQDQQWDRQTEVLMESAAGEKVNTL